MIQDRSLEPRKNPYCRHADGHCSRRHAESSSSAGLQHSGAQQQATTTGKAENARKRKRAKRRGREKSGRKEWGGRRGEIGKEEGRGAEQERDQEIKNDVMGWTVVTRSKKQRKRAVQIFVKLDGMKTVAMEVSPEDKVQKILNTASGSDWDVYVTCEGRILVKKMKSCGVRDGSTVYVMSRTRGGGKHKDKKKKAERKPSASTTKLEQMREEKTEVDLELREDSQEVRLDDGSGEKGSSAEEEFEALDKEMVMEKYRKDMGNNGMDFLVVRRLDRRRKY